MSKGKSNITPMERQKSVKDIETERKKKRWLHDSTLSELHNTLAYVEGLAHAARTKMTEIMQTCAAIKMDSDEVLEKEKKKLFEIFSEHDAWSFEIEEEMDRRLKTRMANKYGAKNLLEIGIGIDTIIKDLVKKYEEENPQEKTEESKMEVVNGKEGESNIVIE